MDILDKKMVVTFAKVVCVALWNKITLIKIVAVRTFDENPEPFDHPFKAMIIITTFFYLYPGLYIHSENNFPAYRVLPGAGLCQVSKYHYNVNEADEELILLFNKQIMW